MQRIKDRIWREIDEIAGKGDMSRSDLEALGQLTDALKDLAEVCAMEEAGGYSEARHYVRGHYSRDGRSYAGEDGYSGRRGGGGGGGRYSREGGSYAGPEDARRHIEAALQTAGPDDREMIERLLDKMR